MLMKLGFSTLTNYDDYPKNGHGYQDGYNRTYKHLIFSFRMDKECANSNSNKGCI